jgi:hypothetical protein
VRSDSHCRLRGFPSRAARPARPLKKGTGDGRYLAHGRDPLSPAGRTAPLGRLAALGGGGMALLRPAAWREQRGLEPFGKSEHGTALTGLPPALARSSILQFDGTTFGTARILVVERLVGGAGAVPALGLRHRKPSQRRRSVERGQNSLAHSRQ